jgi:predicted small metal-binding protein
MYYWECPECGLKVYGWSEAEVEEKIAAHHCR